MEEILPAITDRGRQLREAAKALVVEYLNGQTDARSTGQGVRQATVFQDCGFDWGEFPKATSSNQQYWMVALLNELQRSGLVEQLSNKKWRLTQ
jgi:hypothetical protein